MKGNKAGFASSKLRREPRRQRSRQSSEHCASGVSTKHLDPAHNPAVLDTATWDRGAAWQAVRGIGEQYCRVLRPLNRPRALGATPRHGIGCRMTTLVWPGMFDALRRGNFAANRACRTNPLADAGRRAVSPRRGRQGVRSVRTELGGVRRTSLNSNGAFDVRA
jgi:hypothetical protein